MLAVLLLLLLLLLLVLVRTTGAQGTQTTTKMGLASCLLPRP